MITRLTRQAHSVISLMTLTGVLLLAAGCGLAMDNTERLERAKKAFDEGDYRAATIDTKSILKKEPDNIEARVLLGRGSLGLYDGATAESSLRRAIALGTPLADVAVDLGRALLMNGEFETVLAEIERDLARDEVEMHSIMLLRANARMGLGLSVVARSVYEEILAADPNNLDARLGVVSSYEAEANHQAARKEVDTALELNPDRIEAWLASGSVALNARNADKALQDYDQALLLARESGDFGSEAAAVTGRVESLLAQGDVDAADAPLRRLLELVPNDIGAKYLVARVAYLKQDYEATATKLTEVLQAAPEYIPGRLLMGATQLELGHLGQAESYISGVIAAAPQSPEARAIMAEIRMQQGRPDDVATILAPVIEAGTASDEIKALAVRASMQSGQYDTTVDFLRSQVREHPENQDIRLQLAAALLVAGESEESEAILKDVTTDTAESEFRRDLLRVYGAMDPNDRAAALREAEALAESYPGDPRAHNLLGNIALSLGQLDLARASFAKEQAIVPDSVATYISIANIDLQRGDLGAAREQLVAAHNLQPESIDTMVGLARLEGRAQDTDAARGWLEKARDSDAAAMSPRIFLARLLLSANDTAGAEEVSREALAINANEPAAHNLLGLANERQGKLPEAIENFAKALELAPKQAEYRSNLVRAQTAAGNFEQAEQVLTDSGEVDLDDIQQASMAAALRVRQGDLEGALAIAEALRERHPGSGAPFAIEGELLAADKQYEKASESYDTAIKLSGTDRSLAFRAFTMRRAGGLANPEGPLLVYLLKAPSDLEARLQVAQSFHSRGASDEAIEHLEKALEGSAEFPGRADAQQLLDELRK